MRIKFFPALQLVFGLLFFTGACSPISSLEPEKFAETVFEAYLSAPLGENEVLYLEFVDELTGIALNPTRFIMETKDTTTYFIRIPLPLGSLTKYRFVKAGTNNSIEVDPGGKAVQYRVYQTQYAAIVPNYISGWSEDSRIVGTGEVSGFIYDTVSGGPVSDVLVFINGSKTLTSTDGFYKFENMLAGEMILAAFHPEGKYRVFQQRALISENAITPASFGMDPSAFVNIKFVVSPPENTVPGTPIRILGDLYQFGDTFGQLNGGTSVIASRAPVLSLQKDGTYQISLSLPSDSVFRYKYSLGDGFINAENDEKGQLFLRSLNVPKSDSTIKEKIYSWHSSDKRQLSLHVTIPDNTPLSDVISIQINPYSWMEEFPMWKSSSDDWILNLYSPMEYLDGAQYRICRNEQCGIADDALTPGKNPIGYEISLSGQEKTSIRYELQEWSGGEILPYTSKAISLPAEIYLQKNGMELEFPYNPHWNNYWDKGIIESGVAGAKWLVFSPSWTFGNMNAIPHAFLSPGRDPLGFDIKGFDQLVNEAGLNLALYPKPNYEYGYTDFWGQSSITYQWWLSWFKSYENMVINYAEYAENHGIPNLIIGGSLVSPAIPGGTLTNSPSFYQPVEIRELWNDLIEKVREKYKGTLGFALPGSFDANSLSGILESIDEIYLEFSEPISASSNPEVAEIETRMGNLLDTNYYKLYATYQKPILLAVDYTSVDGTASNCINENLDCKTILETTPKTIEIDTLEQADVYYGILQAVVKRPWISGFFTKGFNPSVAVMDKSSSIHGKPGMQVVSAVFNAANK